MSKDYFKPGAWNAVCGRCGFQFKSNELKELPEFPGVYVCDKDWEPRHILDFFKPRVDRGQSVPWSQDDPDVAVGYVSITSADSPYTMLTTTRELSIDATGGSITITLPAATSVDGIGCFISFSRTDTTSNTVTIQRAGADLIENGTSITLVGPRGIRLRSDDVKYWRYT